MMGKKKLREEDLNYRWMRRASLFTLLAVLFGFTSMAQTLPAGFSRVAVATVSYPSAMACAPDGRIFVGEKAGKIRIIKNGTIQSSGSPFLSLSVSTESERGIGGIVLDPNFSTNGYVYIYYTTATSPIHNRLSRFTAQGDFAVGGETVLMDFEPVVNAIHNSGGMAFGPDGKLYLAVGDDHVSSNAQNLTVHKGKILRLNKDGSTPTDNPFANSSNPVTRKIWAYGLRNPYTISMMRGTNKLYINDVGEGSWEEINDATSPGKNFGWPNAEGNSSNSAYTNPVYTYAHWGNGTDGGCAISGGTFFNPVTTNYPSQYIGKYFFIDYCGGWLNYINSSGTVTKTNFGTGMGSSQVAINVGADGNLYYFSIGGKTIYKIVYNNASAPVITQQPASQSVPAGQPVTFTAAASGAQPLAFQWQKNGVNITGATAPSYTISSVQSSHAGQYRVVVSNSSGTATSNAATLTVTAFNASPVASISMPVHNSNYTAGSVINFAGDATDAEDGTLPASAFNWTVEFRHDVHTHPGPNVPDGVKSGSFTIPTTGEVASTVWYRIILEVTDANGLKDTAIADIKPLTSNITLVSQPPGLQLTYDGQPHAAPYNTIAVEGMQIPIGAVSSQWLNGTAYKFDHWAHGGTATQDITVPSSDISYTAVFTIDTLAPPATDLIVAGSQWKYLDNGSNQGTAWKEMSFSDAGWSTGNSELGYGDGNEATVVGYGPNSSAKYITTYFRKTFEITDKSAYSALTLDLLRDDGAVVYINGQEVYRSNMSAGTVTYTTTANAAVDGAGESSFVTATLGTSALVNGTNVIAVEIHQSYAASSDISFNLALTGVRSSGGGGGGGPVDPNLIISGSSWKYLDNGSNQGTGWIAPAFSETGWKAGNAQLGYGDGDEATVVGYGGNSSAKYITTYFRKTFNVTDKTAFSGLMLELKRDDGAVVYINGQEVYRSNMPAGTISYTTRASTSVDGTAESSFVTANIGSSVLVNGANVIAVELHQAYGSSSDISFDLKLTGLTVPVNDPAFIAKKSAWKYLDNGSNQGTAWTAASFTETGWKTGNGQLGYGDGDEATVVGYGTNSSAKYTTTYFRKTFNVDNAAAFTGLKLELMKDDGAVVYLNGNEIYRVNMPAGAIAYNTFASNYVDGSAESAYTTINLPVQHLVSGSNVIAVEIHQSSGGSSDISFDLALTGMTGAGARFDAPAAADGEPGTEPEEDVFVDIFPNPSNGVFYINYTLKHEAVTSLEVYDALGKKVYTLDEASKHGANIYKFSFSPEQLELDSEVYFIKLTVDDKSYMTKLLYMK
jgi:glucose/arabinose dehydrogenase/transposase-like protein